MSVSKMSGSQSEITLGSLADRIDELEQRLEEKDERIAELEDALADERERRRELETKVEGTQSDVAEIADEQDSLREDYWDLEKVVSGDWSLGILSNEVEDTGGIWERLEDLEAGGVSGESVDRSKLLPIHKMVLDLNGGDPTLSKSEKRAAHLFRRFIRKAAGESSQNVDASGQTYSMTTEMATDILQDEGMLDGVRERSYSKTVGRVMRDVQAFTIVDEHECATIDECDHGLVEFKSGKPHKLRVAKSKFDAAMRNVEAAFEEDVVPSDTDVRTTDEPVNTEKSAEDAEHSDENEAPEGEMDELMNATPARQDGSDNVVSTIEGTMSDSG